MAPPSSAAAATATTRMSVERFEKAAARDYAACARDRRCCVAARAHIDATTPIKVCTPARGSHIGDNKSNLDAFFACKLWAFKSIKPKAICLTFLYDLQTIRKLIWRLRMPFLSHFCHIIGAHTNSKSDECWIANTAKNIIDAIDVKKANAITL